MLWVTLNELGEQHGNFIAREKTFVNHFTKILRISFVS